MFIAWYLTLTAEEREGYVYQSSATLLIEGKRSGPPGSTRIYPDVLVDTALMKCVMFPMRKRPEDIFFPGAHAAGTDCGVHTLWKTMPGSDNEQEVLGDGQRPSRYSRLFDNSQYLGVGWYRGVTRMNFEVAASLAVGTASLMVYSVDANYAETSIGKMPDYLRDAISNVIFDPADGRVITTHRYLGERDRLEPLRSNDRDFESTLANATKSQDVNKLDILRLPASELDLITGKAFRIDLKTKLPVALPPKSLSSTV